MRLIDADALIDVLTQRCCKNCDKRMGTKNGKRRMIYEIGEAPCRACYVDDVKMELDEAPTIDAVQVVRCKDCRWFDKTEDSSYGYCHAMKHGYYSKHWEISIYRKYKEDFYCADGERENETY